MSAFWNYFSEKLVWPQAFAPGPLQAVVRGLAHHLDTTREDIASLREQFFPGRCAPDLVANHGTSRGLVRHPRETPDQFRARVVKAYGWHMLGGKTLGLPQILTFYGFDITRIENMRDSNPAHWAEFGIELQTPQYDTGYLDIIATIAELIWLINEYKPARSKLFRIYTDEYDRRPIVLSNGPKLGDGWLSFYSGVNVDVPGGDDVLVSFGATRRFQAEAYLAGNMAASFGTESVRGSLIPYLDTFTVGRSRLGDVYPRNNPFVIGSLFSILWADRQTTPRRWRGEWDARAWLDYTGFDRKLPHWRMERRAVSRSQLVPSWSDGLSDNNSRLGVTRAVVIDNPGRLGAMRLGHNPERRELRLHEMTLVPRGLTVFPVDPQTPQTTGTAWLTASGEVRNPERVRQAMHSEQSLIAMPAVQKFPEIATLLSLAARSVPLEPGEPSAALTSFLAPIWLGAWTKTGRTWKTSLKLSVY